MKLAVIGGGSSYTPELVDGLFSRLDAIPVTDVWLMDPAEERLAITADLSRRMATRHGDPFAVRATTRLDEAVEGARYVVTQLRVGGIQARIEDEKLGRRHGLIGQETTGIGGFACALRTIPRILDIALAMRRLAPDGWLVNFTNPSGIITEALVRHGGVPAVGLCNVPICMIMDLADRLGADPAVVELDYLGLNHLSWVTGGRVAGEDRTADMLSAFRDLAEEEWEDPAIREHMIHAMDRLHMGFNPYLQYFYATDACLALQAAREKTRGEEVLAIETSLFEKYRRPDLHEKPPELSQRGGAHYSTAAFQLIDAIQNDRGNRQIVCCRNAGAIAGFDDDASVEAPCIIGRDGATPIPQPPPEPIVAGLMQQMKAYETLTVRAAVTASREAAYQAILANPLMPGALDAERLLDDLIVVNRPHLDPAFVEEATLHA
jgi:6-phospho-beta-glucosidase